MNKDLKIASQTIEFLEENIERVYPVIGCGNDFLDMTQKNAGNENKNRHMRLY